MVLETPGSQVLEHTQISSNPSLSPANSGTLGRAQGLCVPTSSSLIGTRGPRKGWLTDHSQTGHCCKHQRAHTEKAANTAWAAGRAFAVPTNSLSLASSPHRHVDLCIRLFSPLSSQPFFSFLTGKKSELACLPCYHPAGRLWTVLMPSLGH